MSHIVLVRHGQANSSARNEADYDRLSPLGHQQAEWLGEYMRGAGDVFAHVMTGTLRRQIETANGIAPSCPEPTQRDARLNELEYFTMGQLLQEQYGIAFPQDREGFAKHMPVLFQHWQDGRIEGVPESFQSFEARIMDVLSELAAGQGRALVVTSGGVIGMAMRHTMGLDIARLSLCCLSIENSSLHRFQPMPGGLAMTQFNALPHLDTPERQHARSHI